MAAAEGQQQQQHEHEGEVEEELLAAAAVRGLQCGEEEDGGSAAEAADALQVQVLVDPREKLLGVFAARVYSKVLADAVQPELPVNEAENQKGGVHSE